MCYHDYICLKLGEARVQGFLKEAENDRLIKLCQAEPSEAPSLKSIAPLGLTILICLVLMVILVR
jgi:hypothetical protein